MSDDPTRVSPVPADPAQRDRLASEIDELRAERDRLAEEAAVLDRRVHGGSVRRTVVGVLAVLACLSFLVATLAVWANRNLLRTDVWVDRVGPTIEEPAVQASLSRVITDEVMELVDPRALFESALPDRGDILAAPLAAALRDFVYDRVLGFVGSDRFEEMWTTILDRAHAAAVAVLRGESGPVVDTADGAVTVNIIPVIDAVLARISEVSPELLGRTIDIPEVTFDDLPDAARDRLGDALGVELDDDFGTFVVYDEASLATVQDGVRLFDRLLVLSVVLTIGLTVAALVVSRRRRRTGLQLLVGFALALVLVRRLALRATRDVLDLVQVPGNRDSVDVVLHAFLDPLLAATEAILFGLGALIVVLVVTGPYPWVVTLRDSVARLARGASAAAGDVAHRDSTVTWVRRNASALQWAGVAVVVVALWWFDLSWLGLLLLLAVVGAAELFVYRIATAGTDGPGAGAEPAGGPPDITPSTT